MEVAQGSGSSPWRKLGLTLALSLVPVIGSYVPMPGIAFATRPAGSESLPTTSLFVLGVGPLLSGYLLVEAVALLVPRLRKLRHGFPDGRARLRRWAFTVAFVLAGFQSFALSIALNSEPMRAYSGDTNTGLLMFSATAATGVLVLAARAIDRLGLVNGIVALSLASECTDSFRLFNRATLPTDPRGIAIMVVLFITAGCRNAASIAEAAVAAFGLDVRSRMQARPSHGVA
jgi:preprotein translocase subunit SecY